jgi:capsular polysaccharide biosynthesis protein
MTPKLEGPGTWTRRAMRLLALARSVPERIQIRLASRVPAPTPVSASELPELIEAEHELFAAQTFRHLSDQAIPPVVDYDFQRKAVYVVHDVDVWPQMGMALTRDWRALIESTLSRERLDRMLRFRRPLRVHRRRLNRTVACIHGGRGWENYYHFMIDCLPRVFGLHDPRVQALGSITLLLSRRLPEEHHRLLLALLPKNVDLLQVAPDVLVRPRRFVALPCLSGNNSVYLPPEYLEFVCRRAFAELGVERNSRARSRIYVSRSAASTRRLKNEDELLSALEPHGFSSWRLEELSLRSQIQLFADAETVLGPDGAAYANIVYSQDCLLFELFAHHNVQLHYRRLLPALQAAGRNIQYANIPGNSPTRDGDFTVNVPQVLERLVHLRGR